MSIDSAGAKRKPDLQHSFSGYLRIPHGSVDLAGRLAAVASGVAGFDISPQAVELEHRGRDSSRIVVTTLARLAPLIGNADGEIQCEVSGDADELWFEFYTIQDGRLFRQKAELVRQPKEEVRSN